MIGAYVFVALLAFIVLVFGLVLILAELREIRAEQARLRQEIAAGYVSPRFRSITGGGAA